MSKNLSTKKPPRITARVILFNEASNKVLFIRRAENDDNGGKWDLPGGKMELVDLQKKPKKECAKRELMEETGLEIKKHHLKSVGELFHPVKNKLFCLFKAAVRQQPEIYLSEEHTEYKWFDINTLPQNLNPSTYKLLQASSIDFKLAT